jgi:CBS domain-containing protein
MRNLMPTTDHVIDHATTPLRTLPPTATLREAATVLHLEEVGAVAVADEGRVLGVVTERDVVDALARGTDPDADTVGHLMTAPAITARPDDRVLDVAILMLDRWIRHVPIVDELGTAIGMVSVRDVLRPVVLQALTPPERLGDAAGAQRP